MNVRLNLASKPLETHRRFIVGSSLVGLFGLLVFSGLGWHVYLARKANAEMRAKSDALLKQVSALTEQRASLERFFGLEENAKLHDRADFINGLIDARSFNWTLMFMDLEKVLPAGVHVVSIEPEQDKGRVEVKLTVGATSDDAGLKFLKALEDSKTFTHVELIGNRIPTSGTSGDQTVLELTAEYSRT
jgi:type IV pilus assembly protein PilN